MIAHLVSVCHRDYEQELIDDGEYLRSNEPGCSKDRYRGAWLTAAGSIIQSSQPKVLTKTVRL